MDTDTPSHVDPGTPLDSDTNPIVDPSLNMDIELANLNRTDTNEAIPLQLLQTPPPGGNCVTDPMCELWY